MSDPYFQSLFAERIGGVNYGKGSEIYKFEKIKRAKRKALAEHPERWLVDFGIGENDEMAPEAVRRVMAEEINRPDTRRRIDNQADAERANGRRLSNLVANGEELVKQAMRNPEFGVGHLEKWAEMLQILKDISANRMPSVADLLKQAAQAARESADRAF